MVNTGDGQRGDVMDYIWRGEVNPSKGHDQCYGMQRRITI